MAISEHTSRIQKPMTRRAVMRTGIAATALAAVPVLAALPEPVDARALADHHAKQLAIAMHGISGGKWRVIISHEFGYVLIVNDAHKAPDEPKRTAAGPQRRRKAVRS